MRNDGRDELDVLPSLKTDPQDREDLGGYAPASESSSARRGHSGLAPEFGSGAAAPVVVRANSGALWALVLALLIALSGLGWWSYQQLTLMAKQLVATQESFAQISEEAAGRIQDISGKVVATESSVTSESESLKLRIKQLETALATLAAQHKTVVAQQTRYDSQLQVLSSGLSNQRSSASELEARLKTLSTLQGTLQTEQAALKAALAEVKRADGEVARLDGVLKGVASEVAQLSKRGDPREEIRALQQDVLILRTQLENPPAQGSSTAEFDIFRGQVSRNINALQAQVQNLQQQLDAR